MSEGPRRVTLLSGFLGSGKTTLLRRALDAAPEAGIAVIINEFGETGLDHRLVRPVEGPTVLVSGGCACCGRREDLAAAMRELLDLDQRGRTPRLRRLIIESSGIADPAPILFTIRTDPVLQHHFQVDGTVVTVDGVLGEAQLNGHAEARKQATIADEVVITKCDLADHEAIERLESYLRTINPLARITRSDLDGGAGDVLLAGRQVSSPATPRSGATADHEPGLDSFSFESRRPVDWVAFSVWLSMLLHAHGEEVLRIKGIVQVPEVGPVSVNCVQHVIHAPEHLPHDLGTECSRLVFITRGIDGGRLCRSLETFVEADWEAVA